MFSGESILNPGLLIDIGMKKITIPKYEKKQNNMRFGGGVGDK